MTSERDNSAAPSTSDQTTLKTEFAGAQRMLPAYFRKRRTLKLPITLSVVLMALNIALMVLWIVLLAQLYWWSALTIGTVIFVLILIGLSLYLVLTVKEIRLNQRQVNFIDSVTHELKSPIAALRLYLETLQMRELAPEQQREFYGIMESELQRLDRLINQLLEVGRLDAIGQESAPEDVSLEPLLRRCAHIAATHHKQNGEEIFTFAIAPAIIHGRRMVLEMIFGNLMDNAIKYSSAPPRIHVDVQVLNRGRVVTRISDNGEGVPKEMRKRIFRIFYRGGNELERRQKGTGLGLYIVRTLVLTLKGTINVQSRADGQPGSIFVVDLPGRAELCES